MSKERFYRVYTHYEIQPLTLRAISPKQALKIALEYRAANPPMIAGGYFGAEHAGSDGPAWMPARPAEAIEDPRATSVPKAAILRYGGDFSADPLGYPSSTKNQ